MRKREDENISFSDMKKQAVLKSMRDKRFRITNQRMILLDIILDGECTCCKEIYYKAIKLDSRIGVATVYRMLNILEEIGAINRKNIYQIQCGNCEKQSDICRITLDDQSEIELSDQKWKQVVTSGLRCCGYLNNQNLESITLLKYGN